MPRPSSTSDSRVAALKAWVPFLGLCLAVLCVLDGVAFSFRSRFVGQDVGKWRDAQWLQRRSAFNARPKAQPLGFLYLGDSTVGYDIRPTQIEPNGFNFACLGLSSTDLTELDLKLGTLLPAPPRAVFLGMIWIQFLGLESEMDFLDRRPPSAGKVIANFYQKPQLSQLLVFPGTRVARYLVEARIDAIRIPRKSAFRLSNDGWSQALQPDSSALQVANPLGYEGTRKGWFAPSHLNHLQRFKTRWDEKGVPNYFIFMPLHPGFKTRYLQAFGSEHQQWKAGIKALYQGRTLDLEDAIPDPRHYRDATHLNAEGARIFSRLLGERIQEMGL